MNRRPIIYLLTSFIAGFSLMTVELTASRVVAPYVGSSVFTWTSVIGVILLGLSIGYYAGGFFADRHKEKNLIWWSFLVSALTVGIIPVLTPFSQTLAMAPLPLPLIILLITSALFFIPSVFLGSLSPIILKHYAHSIENVAVSAGTLSALWSLGSIVGTFATGFIFIGYIGNPATLFSVALILSINGLIFFKNKYETFLSVIVATFCVVGLLGFPKIAFQGNGIFSKESDYYQIKVADGSYGNISDARILFLDFDSHSIESRSGKFLGTYPDIYPIFSAFKSGLDKIFVIGGGSYSLPKYLSQYYPNSQVTVAEIDPQVKQAAEEYFNLGKYNINTEIGDGRVILASNQAKYDLIFEDAFNSFVSLPWHLTTKEFAQTARSRLTDGGIYAVNFISSTQGSESLFFQSMLKTFKEAFPNNYVFTTGSLSYFPQNVVLIGINSDTHRNISEIRQELLIARNGNWLSENIFDSGKYSDSQGTVLTDNFAPVEKLMIPVMDEYFNSYSKFYYSFLNPKV